MKKMKLMTLLMCLSLVFGCQTKQGTGTLIGTGGGALLGAVIGKVAGNTVVGSVVGATVGAAAGSMIGKHMDKVAKRTAEQVKNAKVEEVTKLLKANWPSSHRYLKRMATAMLISTATPTILVTTVSISL